MNINHESQRFLQKKKISDFPYAEKIYTLLNISEEISEKANLRILDDNLDDNLILVHYFLPNEYISDVSHLRGVIINVKDDVPYIVAKSFPYTEEFETKDMELVESRYGEFVPEDNTVTQAFEGTIIRIFKGPVTGKWHISTHKKINGMNSKWAGPFFGEIFDKLWGSQEEYPFDDYFDESKCYIFLISHPENKLVCEPSSSLRLIGIFTPSVNGDKDEVLEQSGSVNLNLKLSHPNVLIRNELTVKNYADLFEKTNNSNYKEYSGIIVYHKKNKTCYKLMNFEYFYKRELRGNEPNFRLRYLQLSAEELPRNCSKFLKDFIELFPEKQEYFKEVDNYCGLLPSYLEKLYIRRYKNSDESVLPREEHFILEKTRRNYDPSVNLQENISTSLKLSNGRQLNAMIKHMNKKPKPEKTLN
jgi:hypothetical protein